MSRKLLNTGIYCFENLINGKKYVGQAHNIERRIYEHEYYLRKGNDKSVALQRAVNKYGLENFKTSIVEKCPRESMSEREIYWISFYKSNNKNYGYNLSSGGEKGLFGYKFGDDFGKKVSIAKKAMNWHPSQEQKDKVSLFHKGRKRSEETKKKMSENHSRFWLGKKASAETIEKLKIAHGGENAYQFGKKSPNASSQYYGVSKTIQKGFTYYIICTKFKGKQTYIGMRKDEIEAARLYDAYVIENNLPNPLNFPEEKNV